MGLRFRKSVTICKGVKLNLGKTGMSITLGNKGYHKTIHQNGNVTTSVDLPGTGIYWTETKNTRNSERNISSRREERQQTFNGNNEQRPEVMNDSEGKWIKHTPVDVETNVDEAQEYVISDDLNAYFNQQKSEQVINSESIHNEDTSNGIRLTKNEIYQIYQKADAPVDWTEILISTSANDIFLDEEVWKYYKSVAGKILKGDIDSYLQVIADMRPLDDLVSFGGDFEFGTDNAGYMEIEFDVMPETILGEDYTVELFCDYICAASIRVARDIFALLPVGIVIVHAVLSKQTVLSVLFNRHEMNRISFRDMPQEIVKQFKNNMEKGSKMFPVNRITI